MHFATPKHCLSLMYEYNMPRILLLICDHPFIVFAARPNYQTPRRTEETEELECSNKDSKLPIDTLLQILDYTHIYIKGSLTKMDIQQLGL